MKISENSNCELGSREFFVGFYYRIQSSSNGMVGPGRLLT
jgi:hypothetical protein